MRALILSVVVIIVPAVLSAQPPRTTQPPAPIIEVAPEQQQQPQPEASLSVSVPAPALQQQQVAEPAPPTGPVQEINVDYRCRILIEDRSHAGSNYTHPHLREDTSICYLKSVHRTHLYEESLDNGVMKRTPVEVREATYVMHNITPDPVAFIVHQPVFQGGHIDSNPKPDEVADGIATFRVYAKPGETIHLHVGERR